MEKTGKNLQRILGIFTLTFLLISLNGCVKNQNFHNSPIMDRESTIPTDIIKITPATDLHPPQLYSDAWKSPIPMPYPISTAGAEDSAFIMPDGNTFFFFFTPDVRVPPEKQLLDGVTGIYISTKQNDTWSKPERIVLQDPGKLALDGAEFVQGNMMWFASTRDRST